MVDFAISDIQEIINELKQLFQGGKASAQPSPVRNMPLLEKSQEPLQLNNTEYQAPVKGSWKSSGNFNLTMKRPNGSVGHKGVDARVSGGTPVYPIANGIVSSVGTDPKGGNVVNINYGNGLSTYYAHLSEIRVHKGDQVNKDTIVGLVGDSGNAKGTHPHLHFEIHLNGAAVDPANYFSIPKYSEVSKDEMTWLPGAKENAARWNIKDHLNQKRVAFSSAVSKITKICNSFYKIAQVHGLTVYHGTDGKNLSNILSEGLKAFKADRWQPKSVYLTYDKETAARYAVNNFMRSHSLPVILEIYLSGKKRIKNIIRDELDRPEEAQYEDTSMIDGNENILSLETDIKRILNINSYGMLYNFPIDLNVPEITDLRGKNIYKAILDYGRQNNLNIQDLKKKMFEIIPPETDYEEFDIAPDGSIRMTQSHYENMHQQRYPKNLPPPVIKYVWVANVPENMSSGKEQISIAPKLLANEAIDIFKNLQNITNKYYSSNQLDNEKMQDIFDTIKDDDNYHLFKDMYSDFENAIENNDSEAFLELLQNLDQAINDEWFDDHYLDPVVFTKFNPQEALAVVNLILK